MDKTSSWSWVDSIIIGAGMGGVILAIAEGPTTGLSGGWTGLIVFLVSALWVSLRIITQLHSDVINKISEMKGR